MTVSLKHQRILIPLLCTLWLGSGAAAAEEYLRYSLAQVEVFAQQGDAAAQLELATALEFGEGVEKNPELAIDWYCRAAVQGSGDAQFSLGMMYARGNSVARNDRLAAYWLRRAAETGSAHARRFLVHLAGVQPAQESGCSRVATAKWLQTRCTTPECRAIVRLVEKLAREFRLEVNLVLSVISAESAFNARARSPKGARGLMQLLPATAARFGVKDIWDPEQNIRGGMAYLRWLLAYFEGDVELALAGYNAGERRVVRYQGVPPYPETRNYVARILREYGKRHHRYDSSREARTRLSADPSVAHATASLVPDSEG